MPTARANGIELEYASYGSTTDPAIVLIRGLGTQMVEWSNRLLNDLEALGLRVVIFDNRDVGLSSKVDEQYELRDMAADVVGLMDALNIPAAHVFGISLGGMVAQLVAVHFPMRVLSLCSVMSSSGNRNLPPMSSTAREYLMRPAASAEPEAAIELSADNAAYFGSPGYPELPAVRRERARTAYQRCYFPLGVSRQMTAVLSDGSRVARLANIVAPTLVIHGADDLLIEPHFGEDTATNIAGAQLQIVPGMGHNIPDSLAPDIAQRVGDFIAAL
jgi:pimeloyl-ACP methyl ester carboxylesterase